MIKWFNEHKISQLSSEQVDCLNVIFKFQSFMYIKLMNNSDKFKFVGANQSNYMYVKDVINMDWTGLLVVKFYIGFKQYVQYNL